MININIISNLLVLAIVIAIITYIIFLNNKLKKKIQYEKERIAYYHIQLNKIELKKYSRKDLDRLLREFFKEKFDLKYNLTYLDITEQFEKQNKSKYVNLCKLLSKILYSEKNINIKDINKAIESFRIILDDFKI